MAQDRHKAELIAYTKASLKPAGAGEQAPSLVALLGGERRSEPTRSAAVWNALQDAGAERGRQARGRKGRQGSASLNDKPFAHPYYWAGFIYTGY